MSLSKPPIATQQPHQYEFQAAAAVDEVPPVQNTYYTVLDTETNTQIYMVCSKQTNDETGAKSLRLRVTIDGVTILSALRSEAHDTQYHWYLYCTPTSVYLSDGTSITTFGKNALIYSKSIKIEMQYGDTAGTNQRMQVCVGYTKLKETAI